MYAEIAVLDFFFKYCTVFLVLLCLNFGYHTSFVAWKTAIPKCTKDKVLLVLLLWKFQPNFSIPKMESGDMHFIFHIKKNNWSRNWKLMRFFGAWLTRALMLSTLTAIAFDNIVKSPIVLNHVYPLSVRSFVAQIPLKSTWSLQSISLFQT